MELEAFKELSKELETTIKTAKADLTKQQTELTEAHKLAMKAIEDGQKLNKDQQTNIDKAISTANDTGKQVTELAQQMADLTKAMKEGAKQEGVTTRGELTKSAEGQLEALKKMERGEGGKVRLVTKAITKTSIAGLTLTPHVDTLVSLERQPLRVRDLLNAVPVTTDSVIYGKQSVRDNQAKIVAEGVAKPYSNYAWVPATANVQVIAHLAKLTLQALADAPRLAAEVESEMRYGLGLVEEAELLNGDGTTGHLNGLMNQATPYLLPIGTDPTNIVTSVDKLRVAILQIHLAYAAPDAHVLNPVDVMNIELLRRDEPANTGGYLFGRPDAPAGQLTLWRLPVVESPSMTVNKFLTGAFKYGANLYEREGVSALISTENADDFEKNLATMRVEERLGLGVRRSYCFVKGGFVNIGS